MKSYKISLREFNGVYFVEFDSKGLGCTLFATSNKTKANEAFDRFSSMSNSEMIDHLNK